MQMIAPYAASGTAVSITSLSSQNLKARAV